VGVGKDRRRFLKEHMSSSIDNIFEILLRLVRGTSSYHSSSSASSLTNVNGSFTSQLAASVSPNAPHAAQQTHVSLAVLSIYRMAAEYAEKAAEEHGRLEERVGNIVRSLPQHLLYKSLDGIFRDWMAVVGLAVPQPPHTNGTRKK
jgi:20S proteasome subunit alpha 6